MKAVVFVGDGRVEVDDVPRPELRDPRDAIVAVRRSSICASDLHVIGGKTPGLREGSVLGHEYVGTITDLGEGVRKHHPDQRVLGSFLIACGDCAPCRAGRFNHCSDRRALGLGAHQGDLDGAQAEFVRVPHADVNLKSLGGVLSSLSDEEALFGGDILTTAFYAAAISSVKKGEIVVVIGAGPVGLLCAVAALQHNPRRVLMLDQDADRVAFLGGGDGPIEAVHVVGDATEVAEEVAARTDGDLADLVIEAVGSVDAFKTSLRCARDGGRITVVGVYGAERYDLPLGMVWLRGLDIRFAGMANIQRHWDDALLTVAKGKFDPSALITHRLPLEDAVKGYELFANRVAMKVVLTP